jgi:3-oxoacyl-[acyl-carrier protein] reductase
MSDWDAAIPGLASLLDLRGRVAVVAGGAGAIGAAICRRLMEGGAAVYSLDQPGRDAPAGASTIACDLTHEDDVVDALAQVERLAGRLDVVVHAAGISREGRLWKATATDWRAVIETNLTSAFHLLHAGVPLMRRTGHGAIVLISSINGDRGKVGLAAYAASKAGLDGLARTAARELGAFGIRVNAVAPGWIDTPLTAAAATDVRERALAESVLGRLGTPDDVARATVFLASGLSLHITGQVLRVDGGQLIG